VGPADHYALLAAPDAAERTKRLAELLGEEHEHLARRLAAEGD